MPEEKLIEALQRLILAAESRENTMGDPISLIDAKRELRYAIQNARETLSQLKDKTK